MSLRGISSISAAQASCLDGSVESVLQWMSGIQEEWLIVFDNADEPPVFVVERFIPPGNRGNILITSRNRSMGSLISFENIIEINEMEEEDAINLLLKASYLEASAKHIEIAKNIVTELGCMPLAVNQAGAYIEAGRCSIDKYLQQFSLHRQTLMSDATFRGASNYDRTVYGTWDLSLKEIKKRASGPSAGDAQAAQAAILILQIWAFYHHSNISKDIFRSAAEESRGHVVDSKVAEKLPLAMSCLNRTLLALDKNGHWDEYIYEQGITILLSFSFYQRDDASGMLSVHPLVHCWSREQMSKSEQQRMYEMGSIILCCAISQKLSSYDYGLRRLIFSHINAIESYGSQMSLAKKYYDDKWNNYIFVLKEIGDWKHAEQLGVQVLDMRKKLLGAEHPDTLTSMAGLAGIYSSQGKWNEAEQLGVQVLEMRKKLLGAEHPDTLISMGNLASTYLSQGRWNEAEQLEVQVLDMRKKVLGAEHPHIITCMGNLASIYSSQGRWNEAEQLGIQVLDIRKKLLGAKHPDTLTSMASLARIYADKGNLREAEQLGVQALDMRKKLLGTEHPDTLRSMENLAKIYIDKGNLKEAEQLEVQVLNMRKKLLGADHPDTLRSMEYLAKTYADKDTLKEAEQLEVRELGMKLCETTTCWIAAEHALQHVRNNISLVSEVFGRWKIQKSEYVIHAGFDESLIKSGVGYLEQIHVFVFAEVDATSPLLSELGRLFSPFSSILFTESSLYFLLVFKDDESVWEFDELVYFTASKFADGGSSAKTPLTVISLSQTSGPADGMAGFSQSSSGNASGEGERNKKWRQEKGKERDMGDKDEADKGSDDPDDPPGDQGGVIQVAGLAQISFEISSEIYPIQDKQNIFQTLTMHGDLTIKVFLYYYQITLLSN